MQSIAYISCPAGGQQLSLLASWADVYMGAANYVLHGQIVVTGTLMVTVLKAGHAASSHYQVRLLYIHLYSAERQYMDH
ncbi:hypothetical protein XENOCAPTIV_015776 [Xenoophorus captivus]|uniref:Uncharacterized protein n=1 Tax=Xenoophorus captivus TaxID=1517983 RepID=A0ABV0RCW2_9TELE